MNDDIAILEDIIDRIERIFSITRTISKEEFIQSTLHQDALIRSLEIIGEAANRLSDKFCATNPEVPVRGMVGLRNVLIHNYTAVDVRIVWDTAIHDIPKLYDTILTLLSKE